jgi:hypothetical protein
LRLHALVGGGEVDVGCGAGAGTGTCEGAGAGTGEGVAADAANETGAAALITGAAKAARIQRTEFILSLLCTAQNEPAKPRKLPEYVPKSALPKNGNNLKNNRTTVYKDKCNLLIFLTSALIALMSILTSRPNP